MFSSVRDKIKALYGYLSETRVRRALAMTLVGLGAHFGFKMEGFDVDTVDAFLSLVIVPVAAAWTHPKPVDQ